VPILKEYELFRSKQKIFAFNRDLAGEQAKKMPIAPCSAACPANLCVQGYAALIAASRYKEALRLIRDRLPFPSICGSVCPHPCEETCIRADYDEPIAINALKRFVAERETEVERENYVEELKARITKKGKWVAVIGSGPAGLTAAYDLALRGYEVTVFEALPVPGGMMTVGIPEYRLPRATLNREIDLIRAVGVDIVTGVKVGRDISFKDLFARGYEAIFIGAGAHVSTRLGIEGEDHAGVLDALNFLRTINLTLDEIKLGKRVAVIGGGDAAIDAARSAVRLGAKSVCILYRRTRGEMPAHPEQVQAAEEEGVKLDLLLTPTRFVANKNGHLKAIECQSMTLGEADETGRPRPVPIAGSRFTIRADTAIVAIGQKPDLSFLATDCRLAPTPSGTIRIDPETGATSIPGIFAGGDVAADPQTVIHAIAAGRRAAYGIDQYLSAPACAVTPVRFYEEALFEQRYRPNAVGAKPRTRVSMIPVAERIQDFCVIEKGLTEAEARAEADRCLACGLCDNCNNCIDNFACPAFYLGGNQVMINAELCNGCGLCADICPNDAIVEVSIG
jgi:putative selenate reductase YgfK subunit